MKIKSGLIPEQFWNRESLLEFVLKPLWQSARRGVKIATDPKARSHAGDLAKKGKQDARRNRLCSNRYRVVVGDDKHLGFEYKAGSESKKIPRELIIKEATSDVVSDECDVGGIRPETTLEAYRDARAHKSLKHEGIPPFWRHEMVCTLVLLAKGIDRY
ncbi:hypothetical protein CTheo_9213 [Ceratobasidium theobromae]|uniref:Uncharacterized protein n=1 Tax=Ceratobasidium theobromae TaxID=1582974 RepID=A0A5N5Q5S1_9AGAM|nr:hypothetical protein CTheo_9213 [Ceratobasidium theobromae]